MQKSPCLFRPRNGSGFQPGNRNIHVGQTRLSSELLQNLQNIDLRDRRTRNYGSCLKVVFCFNASKGWGIYLSAGHPDESGRQRRKVACGSGSELLAGAGGACGNSHKDACGSKGGCVKRFRFSRCCHTTVF